MAIITNFGVPADSNPVGTLMPKLQYRFRVKFVNMGSPALGSATMGDYVTTNVISVTRPALTHEEIVVDAYNSKIRLAGKHLWTDVTVMIRDDVNSNVVKMIGNQLNQQVNHSTQSSARVGADYKFQMFIETLDGTNTGVTEGDVFDSWHLVGCWIPDVQYGELNYATSDQVQITMTVRYDNASHNITNEGMLDTLSHDTKVGKTPTGNSGAV